MRRVFIWIFVLSTGLLAEGLDYEYKFGGRIEYDVGYFDLADESYTESELRRVRLYHKGSFLDKKFFYETEMDFSDDISFKDIYVGYQDKVKSLDLKYRLKLGNIKTPFSLSKYSNSRHSTFMERPLVETFTESRKLGGELFLSHKNDRHRTNLFLALLSNSIDERRDDDEERSRAVARTTYGYKFDKDHLVNLGASYMYTDVNGEDLKYSQEVESSLVEEKYVSTKVKNVDNAQNFGLDALYINNSFHCQAEYVQSNIDSLDGDYTFNGYYGQVGYFLFGSSKNFKLSKSKFSDNKIKNNDIELGFRYSYIDLDDKDEEGGEQKDYSFALNWHVNKHLKFMTNYIIAYPTSDRYDGKFSLVQGRVMLIF